MEHHIKESLNQVELEGRPSELLDDSMKLEHVHQDASKDEMQSISGNVLQEDDLEAEFHLKTWLAVLALFFLNFVQVFALLGPPQIVCSSFSSLYSLEIQAEVSHARPPVGGCSCQSGWTNEANVDSQRYYPRPSELRTHSLIHL